MAKLGVVLTLAQAWLVPVISKWPRDSRNLLPLAVRLWLLQYKRPTSQPGFLLTPANIPQEELWDRKYTYGYLLEDGEFIIDMVLVSQKTGLVSGPAIVTSRCWLMLDSHAR